MLRQAPKLYLVSATVALVAGAASLLFWARAYFARDVLTLRINNHDVVWVEAVRHGFQFGHMRYDEAVSDVFAPSTGWSVEQVADPSPANLHWGFGYWTGHLYISDFIGGSPHGCRLTFVVVPPALIALLCFAGFLMFGWRYWSHRKDVGFEVQQPTDRDPHGE